jgi:hypothetical protein
LEGRALSAIGRGAQIASRLSKPSLFDWSIARYCDKRRKVGSRGEKLLERMRANPRDWRIEDVATVCAAFGVACTPPRKGSHYKVKHENQARMLTVPAQRPIKPVYIEALVEFVDSVTGAGS